jgi:hypothetical protein
MFVPAAHNRYLSKSPHSGHLAAGKALAEGERRMREMETRSRGMATGQPPLGPDDTMTAQPTCERPGGAADELD